MRKVIGRKCEKILLKKAIESNRPELIAVYGRRRIGKTFLIREVYGKYIQFEVTGIYKIPSQKQLKNFYLKLSEKGLKAKIPSDWIEAFYQLSRFIEKLKSKKKKVIFIDEFPWFDTRKSNFLSAFENFWNNFASKRNDLVVVICGSASSYIIKNIIKSKGGLHNRITQIIHLSPFNLFEVEQLLKNNNVKLSQYDIIQIYMTMGGVPHYLEKILPGESVAQIIDRLCFNKDGFLRIEFKNVFASLFEQYENHETIVRILASARKGFTRNEILSKSKISSGGTLTKTLTELEESGFIENYTPFQGTKDSVFRLTDEYSMFYIKYIENSKPSRSGVWNKLKGQQSYKTWSGFTFETICIKHIEQIKEGLKIAGIHSTQGSWIEKNEQNGAQIDLIIDRDDNIINLCEMKFYNTEYTITKAYSNEIRKKTDLFLSGTGTKKSIFITFITTYGLVKNQYSKQLVQNELTIDALFVDV